MHAFLHASCSGCWRATAFDVCRQREAALIGLLYEPNYETLKRCSLSLSWARIRFSLNRERERHRERERAFLRCASDSHSGDSRRALRESVPLLYSCSTSSPPTRCVGRRRCQMHPTCSCTLQLPPEFQGRSSCLESLAERDREREAPRHALARSLARSLLLISSTNQRLRRLRKRNMYPFGA